jgi:hypothetical protein
MATLLTRQAVSVFSDAALADRSAADRYRSQLKTLKLPLQN